MIGPQIIRGGYTGAVLVGPFIDDNDGKTHLALGSLALGSITGTAYKGVTGTSMTVNGSTFVDTTTVAGQGYFSFTAPSSVWSSVGPVTLVFNSPSQHLHVKNDFYVLSPSIYDWITGSTLYVDATLTRLTAAMSKDAAGPGGVGTYDPSTDSLEALRDRFDGSIAPNLLGGGSLSGAGFLSDTISMIRQLIDEPSLNGKYTDADLIKYLQASMATVMADVNAQTDHPVVVRYSFPTTVDKQTYTLPPQVQKVYYIAKINSTTGTKEWEVLPGNQWDFSGYGFRLEGNTIRLLSKWKTAYTLEIGFVPNSEPQPHKGTTATYTSNTITLDTTPLDGTFDTRPKAYAGYILRVLSSTDSNAVYTQDRIISDYNNQTQVATLVEAFSPALAGTITYEVVPLFTELLQMVWAMHTCLTLLGIEGQEKKYALTEREYQRKLRALRLSLKKEFRIGGTFDGRTPQNMNASVWRYP